MEGNESIFRVYSEFSSTDMSIFYLGKVLDIQTRVPPAIKMNSGIIHGVVLSLVGLLKDHAFNINIDYNLSCSTSSTLNSE